MTRRPIAFVVVLVVGVVVLLCGVPPRPAVAAPAVARPASSPARATSTARAIGPLPGIPDPLPAVGHAIGGLARDSANTALDAVAGWVSAGAASLLGALAAEIDRSTSASDAQPWLEGHFSLMRGIVALFAFPLLFAAAITAIIRRDAGVLLRAAFVHLPLAVIGTAAAMAIVGLALAATDACAARSPATPVSTRRRSCGG